MRHDINHRDVFAHSDSLAEDFGLIFEAIADAFRGMSAASPLESPWSRQRWRNNNCPG